MAQAKRGKRSKDLKFKVAIEAIQGKKTVTQIAEEHGIHPNQVSEWKKQLLEKGAGIFSGAADHNARTAKIRENNLVNAIGKQQVRIDFLKKKLGIDDLEIDGQ